MVQAGQARTLSTEMPYYGSQAMHSAHPKKAQVPRSCMESNAGTVCWPVAKSCVGDMGLQRNLHVRMQYRLHSPST